MIFIRLDENISYKIGEAAELIGIRQGVQFEAPRALGEEGLPDEHWMVRFGQRGKKSALRIAFSGDYFTDPERATAELSRITVFYAPRKYWQHLRRPGQAAYVIRWLDRIIDLASTAPAGTQFQLPASFNPETSVKVLDRIIGKVVTRPGRPRKPRKPAAAPLFDD